MKKCKNISGYTDYPMLGLGDLPNKEAPIRHIKILDFDHNKYALVQTDCGHMESIKAGYIYSSPHRCGQKPSMKFSKLDRGIYDQSKYA
jgi:hypothetical protein